MAIIDQSELREERDYCLTCDRFIDDDAQPVPDSEWAGSQRTPSASVAPLQSSPFQRTPR